MIVSIIYLLFSFILEGFMSNIFSSTLSNISIFSTIYTVVAIVVIYPYFVNEKKFFLLIGIFGFFFDVVYTSTFPLNLIFFLLIGLVVKLLNSLFQDNILMCSLISLLCIITYHVVTFIVLI